MPKREKFVTFFLVWYEKDNMQKRNLALFFHMIGVQG